MSRKTYFKDGTKSEDIAKIIGVHRSSISAWAKKYGVSPYCPKPFAEMVKVKDALDALRSQGQKPTAGKVLKILSASEQKPPVITPTSKSEKARLFKTLAGLEKNEAFKKLVQYDTLMDIKDAKEVLFSELVEIVASLD